MNPPAPDPHLELVKNRIKGGNSLTVNKIESFLVFFGSCKVMVKMDDSHAGLSRSWQTIFMCAVKPLGEFGRVNFWKFPKSGGSTNLLQHRKKILWTPLKVEPWGSTQSSSFAYSFSEENNQRPCCCFENTQINCSSGWWRWTVMIR